MAGWIPVMIRCDSGQGSAGNSVCRVSVTGLLTGAGKGDFRVCNHKQFTNISAFFGHVCGNPCNKL